MGGVQLQGAAEGCGGCRGSGSLGVGGQVGRLGCPRLLARPWHCNLPLQGPVLHVMQRLCSDLPYVLHSASENVHT